MKAAPFIIGFSMSMACSVAIAQELETLMVPVDAETGLATDVWLPALEYPEAGWPVILRRTPYGRSMARDDVSGFSSMGFVFVSQDVRGRGDSDGHFLPFLVDAADGRATIEWAASQPWSNGRVVLWGGSAEGVVQLLAAGEGPVGLAGAIPVMATDDVWEGMMAGGVWRKELTGAWLAGMDADDVAAEWRANVAPGEYWDRGRLTAAEMARIDVPMFIIGGFFDIFAHRQPGMHRELVANVSSDAKGDQFLVYGPWTHGAFNFKDDEPVTQGQVEFTRGASYDLFWFELMDFLEWTLRDGDRPSWAPVRYFLTRLSDDGVHATGTFRTLDVWPPEGQPAILAICADGRLAADGCEEPAGWRGIPVDPSSPVPSVGGNNLTTAAGIFDQSLVDSRPDVMFFQTAPVESDIRIQGDFFARLTVMFSGTDGDVIVRLSQVTPAGKVMLLADGAVRGSFIADRLHPAAVEPGSPIDVSIPLSPVAIELPAGHSLRLSIAGTSAPRYEPNPGAFGASGAAFEPAESTLSVLTVESHLALSVTSGDAWQVVEEGHDACSCGEVENGRDLIEPPECPETGDVQCGCDSGEPASCPECGQTACQGCSIAGRPVAPGSVLLLMVFCVASVAACRFRGRRRF
ncbi:MAG TPA: CocE/NonD family hydrolase [Myxococcota bacterium]|nr:CocE/NonD family hydrolase [Myxococcota bacterium]